MRNVWRAVGSTCEALDRSTVGRVGLLVWLLFMAYVVPGIVWPLFRHSSLLHFPSAMMAFFVCLGGFPLMYARLGAEASWFFVRMFGVMAVAWTVIENLCTSLRLDDRIWLFANLIPSIFAAHLTAWIDRQFARVGLLVSSANK